MTLCNHARIREAMSVPGQFLETGRVAVDTVNATAEVETDLRRRIEAGEFAPGDRLPKLVDLMTEYRVRSRSAMDRALRTLAGEGLLTIRQGSGIYVTKRHVVHRNLLANLRLEHERARRNEVGDQGLFETNTGVPDVEVKTTYELVNASAAVAERLQVEVGTALLARTFRFVIAGLPHQVAKSFMTTELAQRAGLTSPQSERLGVGTMMQLREAGVLPDRVQLRLEARMATPEEREALAIGPGTPVFEHWRVMSHQGVPVEVSTAVVASDRVGYDLDIELDDDEQQS